MNDYYGNSNAFASSCNDWFAKVDSIKDQLAKDLNMTSEQKRQNDAGLEDAAQRIARKQKRR